MAAYKHGRKTYTYEHIIFFCFGFLLPADKNSKYKPHYRTEPTGMLKL